MNASNILYRDYVAAPELDQYDPETLADDEVIEESYEDQLRYRREAERELDLRDARRLQEEDEQEARLGNLDQDELEALELEGLDDDEIGEDGQEKEMNLEAFECPLREWIAEDRTRREIHRRFQYFLSKYYSGIEDVHRFLKRFQGEAQRPQLPPNLKISRPYYPEKIREMCARNSSSLEVSYGHLAEMQSLLAIWLTDVPRDMLQIFDEVLTAEVTKSYPNYMKVLFMIFNIYFYYNQFVVDIKRSACSYYQFTYF